jgi:hypothetical protein
MAESRPPAAIVTSLSRNIHGPVARRGDSSAARDCATQQRGTSVTKTGKFKFMAGAALLAISASQAHAQTVATNAELQARLEALEAELQDSQMRAAQAASVPPPAPPSGWWSNTSISGRMYYNLSSIENTSNGAKANGSGFNFDIKRFYVGVDHTFNSMFSANVTTDVTYDSAVGASQLFIKKAYLQAKIAPELTIRLGAADLPWIPYVESIYGYRYLEQTMTDRTKFGTSSDWGVHMLGSLMDGVVNYDFAIINGGGYKKIPIGGGTNHFKDVDFEGRISAAYEGFNLAVGGYTGKLGQNYNTTTYHTAERLDVLGAYVANGFRLGVEYFTATDYSAGLVASSGIGDSAHGISGFGSYAFAPEWAVFGRYDSVDPNTKTSPLKNENYYTLGISWSPTKIVDFALAYKHDAASHGTISTGNGTIGGSVNGHYSEIGLFGNFQW